MTRFAHIADVHLGGWKQPPLQELNFQSFKKAIDICINEKLDFNLIVGDLFDTAFPGIEVLKETFSEFKRLKESKIPCFIVAGSHDYSVSGKTFLDVLEKDGFCKNVENFEERGGLIWLNPIIYNRVAIYGYPGRRSGLEVNDLKKVKFNDSPGMFKIFMLHTTLDKAKGSLPIDSVSSDCLPLADYYALGHLHIDFQYQNFVYPGPVFPNNFQELEDLGNGSFYIVDTDSKSPLKKIDLKIKNTLPITIELKNAINATEKINQELSRRDLEDKIVLLRIKGELDQGTNTDIRFQEIEEFAKNKGAYFLLRNTHELKTKELQIEIREGESENIEEEAIKFYLEQNPSDFNKIINPLMLALAIEKQEGETNEGFTERLIEITKKILGY